MTDAPRAPDAPRRVTDYLTKDEIRSLTQPSDLAGALALAKTWLVIAGAFALAAAWPGPATAVVAIVLLGGQQLGLAIVVHEAAHRSLFRARWANDLFGRWLAGALVWVDVERYRTHHLGHHAHAGTDRDPDVGLVTPFPTSRSSLARKVFRDLVGATGVKRVLAQLAMDVGLLRYTASSGARRTSAERRTLRGMFGQGIRNLTPVLVANGTLAAILTATGHPWLFGLWVLAYLTTFSLFLRIRSIAEHACTEWSDDPFRHTRTTLAGPLARFLVAPHGVNYHLEHHLLMTVPHHRLEEMHRLLVARGALDASPVAPGYLAVLRTVTTPASRPG